MLYIVYTQLYNFCEVKIMATINIRIDESLKKESENMPQYKKK